MKFSKKCNLSRKYRECIHIDTTAHRRGKEISVCWYTPDYGMFHSVSGKHFMILTEILDEINKNFNKELEMEK